MEDLYTNGSSGNGDGGFPEYRRLILTELKRLGREQEVSAARLDGQLVSLRDAFMIKLELLQKQVFELSMEVKANERERKVLSGVWGLLGGAMPIIIWLLYHYISLSGGG